MIYWLMVAFQENNTSQNYVAPSRNKDCQNGRMWVIFTSIETYFEMTQNQVDDDETEIARERALEAITWQRNTNVHTLWVQLNNLITMYSQSKILLEDRDMVKWDKKNIQTIYKSGRYQTLFPNGINSAWRQQ